MLNEERDMMYNIEQRDEQLLGSHAQIRYHCYFDDASRHLVRIRMEVELHGSTRDEVQLTLPAWAPGSYKIRDFITHVGNLHAYDEEQRPLPYEWIGKSRIRIRTGTAHRLSVEYTFYANERTVRTMHISRWRAFIFPVNCMFYVEGRTQETHHVLLYYDRSSWPTLTTALSPVEPISQQTMPVILGALNYDILADSPTEIGSHQVRTFTAFGAHHEVALIAPVPLDIDWLSERCKTIVTTEAAMFGGVPYDRYVFFVYAGSNLTGGLEHARCSVNMCDVSALMDVEKSKSLLALLCHEYFHVWNVKRIRPREYGPFDYTREVHSPMLWLAEGFTSYYDDLFAYRAGFYSMEEYLHLLARDHLGKLLHVPGRRTMSIRESSFLAWVKLYAQSPDGQNRFPSYYLKGGVLALLLDLAILNATDGKRRLDDVMRLLCYAYQQRPSEGLQEGDVFDAIEQVSTRTIREQFEHWLNSTDELDISGAFEPFGIEWIVKPVHSQSQLQAAPRFHGMLLRNDGGRLVVSSVEEGSPAWCAGIAVDDEIIALAHRRVTSPQEVELISSRIEWPCSVVACCDGLLYQTMLDAPVSQEYELRVIASPTERQRALRERWLERAVVSGDF